MKFSICAHLQNGARGKLLCSTGLAALIVASGGSSVAASLTPPNLTTATSVGSGDLALIWPSLSAGPLKAITWANLEAQLSSDLGGIQWLKPSNNLSDVANPTIARTNLGVGTAALGNATSGAWTPTLSLSTPGSSTFSYSSAVGTYVCANGIVLLGLSVTATPTVGSGSGTLLIGGLPYAVNPGLWSGTVSALAGGWTGWSGVITLTFNDTSHLRFTYFAAPGSGSPNVITAAQMTSGASHALQASITYQTASC